MKIFKSLALLFLLCLKQFETSASHIYGGELLYTHLTGMQYKVTLTMYGDCGKITSANPLVGMSPVIFVSKSGTFVDTLVMRYDTSSGKEVSPVCPNQKDSTTCRFGTLPGIKKFVYSATYTMPSRSADWHFTFYGEYYRINTNAAGRSDNITNIQSGSNMSLDALLNNSTDENNSPIYSAVPTPYYCLNQRSEYNQGAFDAERDSLSFELVPAVNGNLHTNIQVSYNAGYSYLHPMAASSFSYNNMNGQMTFTASAIQRALVVNRVLEYRGGVLIGTSEREMTFIIMNNCNGAPPTSYISNLVGAAAVTDTSTSTITLNACKSNSSIQFLIDINNPSGDSTTLSVANLPTGATLNFSNNGSLAPRGSFDWNLSTVTPGIYTFYVTLKNNHCPIASSQTIAYTINIADPPSILLEVVSPTQCYKKAWIKFTLQNGYSPRHFQLWQGATLVDAYSDTMTTAVVYRFDSLAPGSYTVILKSDTSCANTVNLTIVDSGKIALDSQIIDLCVGAPTVTLNVPPVATGATIAWYTSAGSLLSSPPTVSTSTAGDFYWYFIEQYKTCSSGQVGVRATVHKLPTPVQIGLPRVICYGDKIYLEASGGIKYNWRPADSILSDSGGIYTTLYNTEVFTVVATDAFGCVDSAALIYGPIERCCNVSFPTAFSPNNDNLNDEFKVVTWGNMKTFKLSIFNRFGQLVFLSTDAAERWDGKFHGVPCEIGTYYYYMEAECLTGPKKFYKGDVTLVR